MLDGYMKFVEKVREYAKDDDIGNNVVVEKAVEYCINNHILEKFFRKRKDEVIKVMTIDMTFEAREKIFRKEEYEEGILKGKIEGRLLQLIELVKDGLLNVSDAASRAGMTVDEFQDALAKTE